MTNTILSPEIRERSLKSALAGGVGWAVMFGAGEMSFPLLAANIQAPEFFFGLLVGVPCLLGPLLQVWGANALERVRNCRSLVLYAVAGQILSFIPLVALFFLNSGILVYIIFCLAILCYYSTGNFAYPSWTAWISALVSAEQRANYFARFSRNVSAVSLIAQLLVGCALFWAGQSQIVTVSLVLAIAFAVAGFARWRSFCYLKHMREAPFERASDASFTFWQFIRRARESNFVRYVFYIGFFHFGMFLAAPFFAPYILYQLHFEQWQWVVISSSAALTMILALPYWGKFSARFGNKKTLKYTTCGLMIGPILWLFSKNFYYLIIINCLPGVMWAGFSLSFYNYFLEAVTPAKRARCMAYFSIFIGVGSFAGSIIGAWLGQILPPAWWSVAADSNFAYLLIISSIMRITPNLIFFPMFRELRDIQSLSLTRWFFNIANLYSPIESCSESCANQQTTNKENPSQK